MDGTFIKSDMLIETFLAAVKRSPLVLFQFAFWLFRGKAFLKYRLAEAGAFDVATIPLNLETYEFLKQEKQRGRRLVLATASTEKVAKAFVAAYPIFDGYIASSADQNLKGSRKLAKVLEETARFGYLGNSSEDYVLFDKAEEAYLVSPTKRAARAIPHDSFFNGQLDTTKGAGAKVWVKQLRIYQWLKNALIFVPLLVSGRYTDLAAVGITLIAFIAFGLLASSTYVLNDLLDLEPDRRHPRKRSRPLAACSISLVAGALVALVLFWVSLGLGAYVATPFLVILLAYLVLTLSYSLKLKRFFGMDVIALASLYTIRIFAGAAVIGVTVSFWLLGFSMFVFLSLALVKRGAELVSLREKGQHRVSGRDYQLADLHVVTSFGTASSLISLLMFCFYLDSDVLKNQYRDPQLLWLAIPCMCYWLMRMWSKTLRGDMDDDPIVFTLKDRASVLAIVVVLSLTVVARLP
ncbi:UbiA family prenyltransferase [Stieleria sp. JC731]|nr:UbiA family prenyltransferase [Stieleria sp. JC731]